MDSSPCLLPVEFDNRIVRPTRGFRITRPEVEVRVDPKPVDVLLEVASDDRKVLCLASHDRPDPAAKLMKSAGSQVIARTPRPLVVVGREAAVPGAGAPVVAALDALENAEPLLAVAAAWLSISEPGCGSSPCTSRCRQTFVAPSTTHATSVPLSTPTSISPRCESA
jgi:hypothetical protein